MYQSTQGVFIMGGNYIKSIYKDYEKAVSENEELKIKEKIKNDLIKKQERIIKSKDKKIEDLERKIKELEKANKDLEKESTRLSAILNNDGTNSGIPTSKTPINKNKIIPNSRNKGNRNKGGQTGHPQKKLKKFEDSEITEEIEHIQEVCPFCGGKGKATEKTITKDELDYELVVIKRRHIYKVCKCEKCRKEFHETIATELKEENQYGSGVKSLALALMNIGNVSINKTVKMIYGLSKEEICPSEGYVAKLQKRYAKDLGDFYEELRKRCITLGKVYWDDTVIGINTARGCLRFYGDEKTALYAAHLHKDKKGLDEDKILQLLPKTTIVMHDHNKVNYNADYSFRNVECNVHLLRDLQKVTDILHHEWSSEMKKLLEETNKDRNKAIKQGEESFEDEYVKNFFERYETLVVKGIAENNDTSEKYYGKEEAALLNRITDYKDNYFAWVTNFDIPFSNNLSERSLRDAKSKMKISGQFQSEDTAKYYAIIKSYIETCYRNGINPVNSLRRLCNGNPYTVTEIFAPKSDEQ